MGQVSAILRNGEYGFTHWCPGCEEPHFIHTVKRADGGAVWTFNGNVDTPTFGPSIKITGKQTVNLDGKWTGEWVRDAEGNPIDFCCHYFIIDGQIQYCSDSTHSLKGQTVPLPRLPEHLSDERGEV